jgi:citrate synthase
MMTQEAAMGEIKEGLEGVVAARTRLSMVDGLRGELVIGGYPVEELAANACFEEVLHLLWAGALPNAAELAAMRAGLASRRILSPAAAAVLRAAAAVGADPMDALRAAAGTVMSTGDDRADALAIVAALPVFVAAYSRLRAGLEPIPADPALGHAADLLWMTHGVAPAPAAVRGLDTYLATVVDHGLNASTFAARVVTSTGSDVISAVVAAIGALKGPLHGGAPGPALATVFEIGTADRAEAILRAKLARGERLMGFGHRIYKVRDPRAVVLAAAAERMFSTAGDRELYALAHEVEAVALRLLAEAKPGRNLQTNVEFYTALLLHGLAFDTATFTPVFAVGRVGGWTAHAFEQRAAARLIRPQSEYTGPRGLAWPAPSAA